MFKRKYRVETIVTQKNGLVYKTSHIAKMSRKEAEKLANTKKIGVLDTTKGYKWIVYNVIDLQERGETLFFFVKGDEVANSGNCALVR